MVRREALGKGIGALFSEQEEETAPESEVITKKSEVITKKSEVIIKEPGLTTESEVDINKSEVTTNELEVNSKKLGVITQDKREREKKIPEIKGLKSRRHSPAIKINKTAESVNQEILEQAISEALKSPRISTWSPLVMSALRYLQLTTARFSMSKEVSETLEAAFREKYPDLFERIEKEIEKG